VAGRWFSSGTPVSSFNKIDRHDMTESVIKHINPRYYRKRRLKRLINCLFFTSNKYRIFIFLTQNFVLKWRLSVASAKSEKIASQKTAIDVRKPKHINIALFPRLFIEYKRM
jgi:hypothetical protein